LNNQFGPKGTETKSLAKKNGAKFIEHPYINIFVWLPTATLLPSVVVGEHKTNPLSW
jgi:hypothetical protein